MQLVRRAVLVVVSQSSWLLQAHTPFPEAAPCSPVPFSAGLRHPSRHPPHLLPEGFSPLAKLI